MRQTLIRHNYRAGHSTVYQDFDHFGLREYHAVAFDHVIYNVILVNFSTYYDGRPGGRPGVLPHHTKAVLNSLCVSDDGPFFVKSNHNSSFE